MQNVPYDGEEPTRLDMILSLLQKTGTSESIGSVHAVSVRLPTVDFSTIEALAAHSGHSRNKIICQLLSFALSAVWDGLDAENQDAVQAIRSKILGQLVGSFDNPAKLPQAEKGEI